jgi:ABC-type sugar transport system ATPase subunit
MTGRDVAEGHSAPPAPKGATVCHFDDTRARTLKDLSFSLQEGEVLGLAGLENAGQSDLLRLLLGDLGRPSGRAEIDGHPLPRSPAQAWARASPSSRANAAATA